MSEHNDRIERVTVAELDAMLGKTMPVLDDGFVRVIDYMGSDKSIVQAARISYGSGTKQVQEDRGLIRYLMRHRHTTPFEMCEIKLHVRVPMDCWRQWIRHRTANVNEYSTRYSEAIDVSQRTEPSAWRLQSAANKQGSGTYLSEETGTQLSKRERELQALAREIYTERLQKGVAREQARKDLPLSTYTEAYWKIDLHNLLHFLSLRLDSHAQFEIRSYAQVIGSEVVANWCPIAWEAFQDFRMNALVLSNVEASVVECLAAGDTKHAIEILKSHGFLEVGKRGLKRNRERDELQNKITRLGFDIPWQESDNEC